MKQNYFLLLLCIFSSGWLSAQESAVTSGGSGSGAGGSNTYSVGQITYSKIDGIEGSAIQGVQQPYEIFLLGIEDHPTIKLEAMIYPNPTPKDIILKITTAQEQNFHYILFDLNGKLLRNENIREIETSISMETYADAIYLLKVYSNQFELKTFKIIKKIK